MVAVDLLRGDSSRDENILLWKRIDLHESQSRLKDTLIASKDSIIALKDRLLSEKDTTIALTARQAAEWKSLSGRLEKQFERQRARSLIKDLSAGLILILLILLK